MNSNPTDCRRLDALTSIRAIAALHVVVFHLWGRGEFQLDSAVSINIIATGYIGVSLFFVLSGFVLIYNYRPPYPEGKFDSSKFWRARFARVYPLYLFALLLSAPLYFAHAQLSQFGQITKEILVHLAMLQAWDYSRYGSWNFPSWSLSGEAFFYLLFPAIAVWMSRKSNKTIWAVVIATWLMSFLASAHYRSFEFTPLLRLSEFVFGIVVGLVFLRGVPDKFYGLAAAIGCTGVLGAIAFRSRIPEPYLRSGLLVPCFGALILGLAKYKGPIVRPLQTRLAILLGEASYGIYILHIPINDWLMIVCARLGIRQNGPVFVSAYLAILIVCSILTYKLLEVPARRVLLRSFNSEKNSHKSAAQLSSAASSSL